MQTIRNIIGTLIIFTGIIIGVYVGGWLMFVMPVWNCCEAFIAHTLTSGTIIKSIIQTLLAYPSGTCLMNSVAYIGGLIKSP